MWGDNQGQTIELWLSRWADPVLSRSTWVCPHMWLSIYFEVEAERP